MCYKSKGAVVDTTALTTQNILEYFDEWMADMDDASVPQEGRILYLTSAVQKLLKEADGITRTMSVGAAGVIDRRVHGLDDVTIKTVPSARFKDKYDFTTGCVPAESAKQINMILVHPSCVISRDKYAYMKLFTPGSDSRTADKYVYQNRYYTDTFLIENNCSNAMSALVTSVKEKWNAIKTKFNEFKNWLASVFQTDWSKRFGFFGNVLNIFLSSVKARIQGIKNIFNGLIKFVKGVFTGNWRQAWDGIKQIFVGVFQGLTGLARSPINAIISAFNAVIGTVNSMINKINSISFRITVPSWIPGIGGSWWGFNGFNLPNIGSIPFLAQGGYVKPNTPQLAVIGDNRHQGEVVAPEGKLKEMAMAAVQAAGPGVSRDELESIINRAVMRIVAALAEMGFYIDSEQIGRATSAARTAADRRFNAVEVG